MRRWLVGLLKSETILIVATVLALISCFIVPPDADYKGYVHMSTISQLVCLMLVVCGLQRIGVFRIIGSRLLHHVRTARGSSSRSSRSRSSPRCSSPTTSRSSRSSRSRSPCSSWRTWRSMRCSSAR